MEYALPAGLFLGILLVFGAISSMLGGGSESVEARMARYAGPGSGQIAADAAEKTKKKAKRKRDRKEVDPFATLSADVEDKRFTTKVQRDLARANLKLRVAEYYYIRIGASLALGVILFVFRDPVSGIVGFLVGYMLPRFWVGRRISGRLNAFNKQLPDTITLLSNSLRAGSSFLQSIELVSREGGPPMSEEMGRVVREVNLGLGMEEALHNLVRRIKSDDLDLMVTAIGIQQQVGGNLAEILDTIAFTIRERVRIKGEINTLTAQGRVSGYLVAFLPIGLGVALNAINPAFMAPLFTETVGRILIGVGAVMMTIGFLAIRKITDIKV
ncbi:MAG TPA: type II secretion system F family protein [Candidatus Saccharimonadales bacterium]|nr:type II secretion system F family protein [Candidatus Saccharimonadales bacterium]